MVVEIDAVLAGYVIEHYHLGNAVYSIEGLAESEVHIHLSFTLLKIYNACWYEATMPCMGNGTNSSSIKMAMGTMGTFDGMVLIASRFLQDSFTPLAERQIHSQVGNPWLWTNAGYTCPSQ